ncbi:hypothetical protein H4R21_000005 [Coemansia helicoidea]|uniref:Uncharacterized protein n=1 Tax=Coemansia helicoidea TaxID=1286919 RepID=A0ACC1LIR9_9FUNG|nr:hypothetical protein H4R21_000005 [Coemansia helicoidea]
MNYFDKLKATFEKLTAGGHERQPGPAAGGGSAYPGSQSKQSHPPPALPTRPHESAPGGQGHPPPYGDVYPPQQAPYPPTQSALYPPMQQAPYPPMQQAPYPPYGEPAAAADTRSDGRGVAHNIEILNVRDNELVHQRFLIVHGQMRGMRGRGDDQAVVHHPYFPPLRFPAADGYFKVLAELESGENVLRFDYLQGGECIGRGVLTVRMAPFVDKPPLLLGIIVGRDSQGVFDAPPDKRGPGLNDTAAAARKLRCCAYLWQAFMAEQMYRSGFGRRTFNLEEYYEPDTMAHGDVRRMTARVHVIRSKRTVAEIRAKESAQQWRPAAGEKLQSEMSQFAIANEALDDSGLFKGRHHIACLSLDSHWDAAAGVIVGHAALGGSAGERRIGVFGSHTTHAWPSSAEEIAQRFLDTTKTDTRILANDANECGEYWQTANTGMGSFLHECGHLLTLAHTPSGMMRRGCRDYNRAFMARAPNWKGPVRQTDEAEAHWHRTDLIRLRHHPCLRLPSDPPLSDDEKQESAFDMMAVEDGVVLSNASGITMVEVWVNDTYRGHVEYTGENYPERLGGKTAAGADEAAAAFPLHVHLSSAKLRGIAGQWGPSDKVSLVLTSRATVTQSFDNFDAFVRSNVRQDRDGNRIFSSCKLGKGEMEGTVRTDALFAAKSIRSSLPKLRSIEFRSGCYVDGIVFHFDDGSRAQIGTCQGGGRTTLPIEPDDDLDYIIVNCGWWIDGLEFVTVQGRRSGWKGGAGGGRVKLAPPPGYSWMGLSGSGGRWLDSLTMHYAKGM